MKSRPMIYLFAVLALVVGWSLLLAVPEYRKARSEQLAAQLSRQRLNDIQQLVIRVPAVLEAQRRVSQEQLDLNSRLYARGQVLHLFEDLSAAATHYRLKVEEITPPVEELLALNRNRANSDQPQFINMTVRLTGGYVNFGEFVQALEQAEFFRGVNRCLVTGSPDGRAPLQMTVGFKALVGAHGVDS